MSNGAQVRVLHILGELKPSGAELMLLAASPRWRQAGITGEIICTGQRRGALAPQLEESGFVIHHVPFSRSIHHILAVFRLIRNSNCQVVHLHTERANVWYGLAALMARRRMVLRTFHNVFPFQGALRVRRFVSRTVLRTMGVRSIAISESVRDCEAAIFHNPTEVVPNWFDDRKYVPSSDNVRRAARRQLGISGNAFVVLTVAGCWEYKNHGAILHALASMPDRHEIIYLHVGMEDEHRSEAKLAEELGIDGAVRFIGVVDDITPYLCSADAYLMPSFWEGFGCSAIEAMGAGLPVVLSRVEGLRDFARICPDVIWVNSTADSVRQAIQRLQKMTPERRRAIGLRLSESAHRSYGTGVGAVRYAEIYLQSQSRRRPDSKLPPGAPWGQAQ